MAAKLLTYLTRLSTEHAAVEEFRTDRDAALASAGLTEEQAAAVKSGDSNRIQAAVAAELTAQDVNASPNAFTIHITITVHITIGSSLQ
jgi:hypothetical protein